MGEFTTSPAVATPLQGGATTLALTATFSGLVNGLNPATVTFFPQGVLPDAQGKASITSAYQATAPGYATMYENVAAHEIGHLLGIGDYISLPVLDPSNSVVMPTIGVNNIGNPYQKVGPTSCDLAQATSVENYIFAKWVGQHGLAPGSKLHASPPPNPNGPWQWDLETWVLPNTYQITVTISY